MDMPVCNAPPASDSLDLALRRIVEHLLSDTVKQPCYRALCREYHADPNAVYQLIDGLSDQIKAKDEQIRTQLKIIERLRFQLVELVKECTTLEGGPRLQ